MKFVRSRKAVTVVWIFVNDLRMKLLYLKYYKIHKYIFDKTFQRKFPGLKLLPFVVLLTLRNSGSYPFTSQTRDICTLIYQAHHGLINGISCWFNM